MSSRYIQITPWALLEYEYGESNYEISVSTTKALKITNGYTNNFHFVNGDIAFNVTGNVLDNSVVPMSSLRKRWGYTDIDAIVPLIGSDPNLSLDDAGLTSSTIKYDSIKIHIVSGYNLEGLDGIIASIQFKDRKDKYVDIANHVFRINESEFNFNSSPIFLGDRLYDRFIEFKIPALAWINKEFLANPGNTGGFAYKFTTDNLGFDPESLILFSLYEIDSTEVENGNMFFTSGNKYEVSFLPVDQFGLLGAVIRESTAGDYFEYFGTWDGGMIDDYIANLNGMSGGNDWAVVHQIEVIEQIGTEFFKTSNFSMLQDNNFDQPIIFRPVIINASSAIKFSIDYTMRLFNKKDGQQIIRMSSLTYNDPAKYGKEFDKIKIESGFNPVKVYNKIVTSESSEVINIITNYNDSAPRSFMSEPVIQENITNSNGTTSRNIVDTKYIPTFFSNTNISITSQGQDSQELDGMIFGQGKAYILLNEYDNRIRFKLYDRRAFDKELEMMDLTTYLNIRLSFILDSGQKLYIDAAKNDDIHPTAGEIEFLIDSEISSKVLNQNDKRFFLVSTSPEHDTDETVLYQGKFENFSNRADVIDLIDAEKIKELDRKIKQLEQLQYNIEQKNKDLEVNIQVNKNLISQQEIASQRFNVLAKNINSAADKGKLSFEDKTEELRLKALTDATLLNKKTSEYQTQISKSIQNNKVFELKEIPGENIDLGSNLKVIRPKTIVPSSPTDKGVIVHNTEGIANNTNLNKQ